ncbi:MAG: hypothetical protein C0625_15295 [Arcobacter sp.]|nr:MAG: hypothetical protein C0625_15295 [Arcobacter sp.]
MSINLSKILYSDCKEIHPITFEWATIIDESSDDDISIFENLHKYLLPEQEEYLTEKLEINSIYKKLFELIDTNNNSQLEAQELEDASKNEAIKKTTSKYIVKHSSEWDKKINLPKKIKEILQKHKENIKNYADIIKHLDNEEKRVNKLALFEECKGISDFPASDKVFHFNPIGLVGEFGNSGCLITKEMLAAMGCTSASNNQELIDALNKYCPQYEINTCLRVAHFLSQCAHESTSFTSFGEGINFTLSNALGTWPSRATDINAITVKANGFLKQPDLFNSVYGTRNGNVAGTDDGYNFRGRGLIQLTGRTNYTNYKSSHDTKNPDDIQDFVNNPDLVKTKIAYAVESACWYWVNKGKKSKYKNINTLADMGTSAGVINAVGASVNGWYDKNQATSGYIYFSDYGEWIKQPKGHADRTTKFNAIKNHLGL